MNLLICTKQREENKKAKGSFPGFIPTSSDIKKKLVSGPTNTEVPHDSRTGRVEGIIFYNW